ncbi:MAG: hypothetical protein LBE62_02415 [Azonexus sp.]|nr:hypothetical protein [Azonexus sp.]
MSTNINGRDWNLEPEQVTGKGWRVVMKTGSRKKGTKVTVPVSDPDYTLAEAQTFIRNNRAADFADAARSVG